MVRSTYIIIVTYNAMQWLPNYLESTKPYPTIIVDNNSQDNTLEYVENQHPEITLFKQQKNLGFGQANNVGISHALNKGADYVFLLNQDACLQDNCIERLVKVQLSNTNFGILSPIHLNGTGDKLDHFFSTYLSYARNKDFYSDFVLDKPKKEVYEVPFVNAAGWLISRECIETVGGFDPIFFHYGEDKNLCQRVIFHQMKIGIVPNVFLRHDREERIKIDMNDFALEERNIKIKYADINNDGIDQLEEYINNYKKSSLKTLLMFQFSKFLNIRKRIVRLQKISVEIQKSRILTMRKRASYLIISR